MLTGSASKITFINLYLYIKHVGLDTAFSELEVELPCDCSGRGIKPVQSTHWRRLSKKWKLLYLGPSLK